MKKAVFAPVFAAIALSFAGCPMGGTAGQTPDPLIGVWKYTSLLSRGGSLPQAAMVSFAPDGSCAGAYIRGSSGSYTGSSIIGLWSVSTVGYYISLYSLPVSASDWNPTTGACSLSADRNTLTIINPGAPDSKVVYTRVAAPASAPLIGVWKYSQTLSSGSYVPQAAIVSFAADGSCVGAYINGSSGSYTGSSNIGLWSVSTGGYEFSAISLPVSLTDSSPTTRTCSLSADQNTLTFVNPGPSKVVFTRVAAPAPSPLIGVWKYTGTTSPGGFHPQAAIVSFAASGSYVGAYINGSSGSYTYTGVSDSGLWSVSTGGYEFSSYSLPVSLTDPSPTTRTCSLSADLNTLTITTSGASASTAVFLRQ